MKVSFLFPGSDKAEALDVWVTTIARHCKQHEVALRRAPIECIRDDVVLVLTEGRTYPKDKIDHDIVMLAQQGIPFGVVHNHDRPAVPSLGDYPSFVWTEQASKRLRSYDPVLLRQPVLPPLMEPKQRKLHLGTFGHVEPKKSTLEMAVWATNRNIPFTAYCPTVLAGLYKDYIAAVKKAGALVVTYDWHDKVEDLGALMDDVSHFLFVLPPAKGGSGGSPTSPRYATAFARPVIVVDDETTLCDDGVYVFWSLDDITGLEEMTPPPWNWNPDAYISELSKRVLAWRKP